MKDETEQLDKWLCLDSKHIHGMFVRYAELKTQPPCSKCFLHEAHRVQVVLRLFCRPLIYCSGQSEGCVHAAVQSN